MIQGALGLLLDLNGGRGRGHVCTRATRTVLLPHLLVPGAALSPHPRLPARSPQLQVGPATRSRDSPRRREELPLVSHHRAGHPSSCGGALHGGGVALPQHGLLAHVGPAGRPGPQSLTGRVGVPPPPPAPPGAARPRGPDTQLGSAWPQLHREAALRFFGGQDRAPRLSLTACDLRLETLPLCAQFAQLKEASNSAHLEGRRMPECRVPTSERTWSSGDKGSALHGGPSGFEPWWEPGDRTLPLSLSASPRVTGVGAVCMDPLSPMHPITLSSRAPCPDTAWAFGTGLQTPGPQRQNPCSHNIHVTQDTLKSQPHTAAQPPSDLFKGSC